MHQKGSGVIEDISYRGALIGTTRVVPDRGELVGLGLELANLGAVVLIGRMVRLTISGFAIEFDHLDARAKEFVDSVAAIVHGREIWRSSRAGLRPDGLRRTRACAHQGHHSTTGLRASGGTGELGRCRGARLGSLSGTMGEAAGSPGGRSGSSLRMSTGEVAV